MKRRGLLFEGYFYWISLGALFGFFVLFNIVATFALTYLGCKFDLKTIFFLMFISLRFFFFFSVMIWVFCHECWMLYYLNVSFILFILWINCSNSAPSKSRPRISFEKILKMQGKNYYNQDSLQENISNSVFLPVSALEQKKGWKIVKIKLFSFSWFYKVVRRTTGIVIYKIYYFQENNCIVIVQGKWFCLLSP